LDDGTIENREDTPLDLTGWSVSDEANHRYLFPNFTLKAKAVVTLRTCSGRNTESELFWGSRNSIWNNDGGHHLHERHRRRARSKSHLLIEKNISK